MQYIYFTNLGSKILTFFIINFLTQNAIRVEGDYGFATGQRVKVIKNKGKSRVMPLK